MRVVEAAGLASWIAAVASGQVPWDRFPERWSTPGLLSGLREAQRRRRTWARLHLPVPGDPAGLPPGVVPTAWAVSLTADGGRSTGATAIVGNADDGRLLVMTELDGVDPLPPAPSLSEARRTFVEALRTSAEALERLDAAGRRTGVDRTLDADTAMARDGLPPVMSDAAVSLLGRAALVLAALGMVEVNAREPLSVSEFRLRDAALQPLGAAARRAVEAASGSSGLGR